MVIDYVGAKELSGPLLIFGRVPGIFNEEMAEIRLPDGEIRQGRVVGMDGEHTVIQLFQGTSGISLSGVRAHFTGRPVELALSREILGRMFDGAGPSGGRFGTGIFRPQARYQRSCDQSGLADLSAKLYLYGHFFDRCADYADPRTETAYFFGFGHGAQ